VHFNLDEGLNIWTLTVKAILRSPQNVACVFEASLPASRTVATSVFLVFKDCSFGRCTKVKTMYVLKIKDTQSKQDDFLTWARRLK